MDVDAIAECSFSDVSKQKQFKVFAHQYLAIVEAEAKAEYEAEMSLLSNPSEEEARQQRQQYVRESIAYANAHIFASKQAAKPRKRQGV